MMVRTLRIIAPAKRMPAAFQATAAQPLDAYHRGRQEDQGELNADQDQLGPPGWRAEERQHSGVVQFRNERTKAAKVAAITAKISRAVVMRLT
jgi:hypothetical protein